MKSLRIVATALLTIVGWGMIMSVIMAGSCNKERQERPRTDSKNNIVDVTMMGAVGNGVADDTKAFQRAIDHVADLGGGIISVPKGTYLIDSDTAIRIKSYTTLRMDSSATLVAKPTASKRSYVLLVLNATDVMISGGKIKGDRSSHLDTIGEWGMGIAIYAGQNVTIEGTRISDCWGDGIVIGSKAAAPYLARPPSRNVTVKNVVSDNNRRQGITIGKANQVLIDSCVFSNTNGTKPMAGIDIEPDRDTAQNIIIRNSEFFNNKGSGVEIYVNSSSVVRNVVIQNNSIHHNTYGGYIIRGKDVTFNQNRIFNNKYKPPIKAVDTVNCNFTPNTYQ